MNVQLAPKKLGHPSEPELHFAWVTGALRYGRFELSVSAERHECHLKLLAPVDETLDALWV